MAIFQCPKKGCQITRSPWAGSSFNGLNKHCNSGLTFDKLIVEFVFMFVLELHTQMIMGKSGISNE